MTQKRSTAPNKKHVNVVAENDESDTDEYKLFIQTVKNNTDETDWHEIINVGKNKFSAKLDTSAQCNVLPKRIGDELAYKVSNSKSKKLISVTNDSIAVLGETTLQCRIKDTNVNITFKVVQECVPALLGRKSCEEFKKLHVLQRCLKA